MEKTVKMIIVEYSDGSRAQIDQWQIEQIKALEDTVSLLLMAESVFRKLEPIFAKKKL